MGPRETSSKKAAVAWNVNGLKTPLKRQRMSDCIKSKTELYDVYKNYSLNTRK